MISTRSISVSLVIVTLLAFIPSGRSSEKFISTNSKSCSIPPASRLRAGDVVLRKGRGVISEMLTACSLSDPTFSHAGILIGSPGHWQVCHMIGGETSGPNGLVVESLDRYCSNGAADSALFIRLTNDPFLLKEVVAYCRQKMLQAPSFDFKFDLTDSLSLYCTEFVYRAYGYASNGTLSLPLTRFKGLQYVACDNLYKNDYAKIIH